MECKITHNVSLLIMSIIFLITLAQCAKTNNEPSVVEGVLKNSSANHYEGENTFALVQAKFESNNNKFFCFKNKDNVYITVKEYNDGLCYCRIFINSQAGYNGVPYDVFRKDYYKYTIDEIRTLGYPESDLGNQDKTKSVDQTSNIKVILEVLPWVPYENNIGLEQ